MCETLPNRDALRSIYPQVHFKYLRRRLLWLVHTCFAHHTRNGLNARTPYTKYTTEIKLKQNFLAVTKSSLMNQNLNQE